MRIMKMKHKLISCLFLASTFGLSAQAVAQQSDNMETVEVTGKHPASWYRDQAEQKEQDFYTLFNSLIDKEEFKVECKYKKRDNNSRVKARICEAQFVSDIMNKSYPGLGRKARQLAREQEYRKKATEQVAYMEKQINAHESLKQEYILWQTAKQQYLKVKDSD